MDRKYMNVILDVFVEVGSILIMGCIFITVYVYGKRLLIKMGLIDNEHDDEST